MGVAAAFKKYLGQTIGLSALFHRDATDSPVPTGETNPLPMKLTGSNVQQVPGQTLPAQAVLFGGASGNNTGTLMVPVVGAPNIDTISPTNQAMHVFTYQGAYNDGTAKEERIRNNTEGTLLAGGTARTATTASPNQTNFNARGVLITLRVTAAGTGSLTVVAVGYPPSGGSAAYQLNATPGTITANGVYTYLIYPGASGTSGTSSGIVQSTSAALPRTWFARVNHSDGSSWTYSVDYQYIV